MLESYQHLSDLNYELFNNLYDSELVNKSNISSKLAKELNKYGDKCIEFSTNVMMSLPYTDEELI